MHSWPRILDRDGGQVDQIDGVDVEHLDHDAKISLLRYATASEIRVIVHAKQPAHNDGPDTCEDGDLFVLRGPLVHTQQPARAFNIGADTQTIMLVKRPGESLGLGVVSERGATEISRCVEGQPAWNAGLRVGDQVRGHRRRAADLQDAKLRQYDRRCM